MNRQRAYESKLAGFTISILSFSYLLGIITGAGLATGLLIGLGASAVIYAYSQALR